MLDCVVIEGMPKKDFSIQLGQGNKVDGDDANPVMEILAVGAYQDQSLWIISQGDYTRSGCYLGGACGGVLYSFWSAVSSSCIYSYTPQFFVTNYPYVLSLKRHMRGRQVIISYTLD